MSVQRVLGIDPGLAVSGWGVVEGDAAHASLVACGSVRTSPRAPRAVRLHRIFDAVRALVREHEAHEVAVEQQYVAENVRTAMSIGEARAAVLVAAASLGVPVFEYPPAEVKESVAGYGGAPKEQVQQMVMAQLALAEPPRPLDVTDALAVALTRFADARLGAALERSGAGR